MGTDWAAMSRYPSQRGYLHRTGRPTSRLVRFADDLVTLVLGTTGRPRVDLDAIAVMK